MGIRVHPDDSEILDLEKLYTINLRQIIQSLFLQEPVVIQGTNSDRIAQEETVDGQLIALFPTASALRWDTETRNEL